ncbi:hypothetical protein ACL6C3_21280 [Capilliphycus salinus ALCB114379]|uniref:hypothetical protein n=1 Tax=Capilliphycus salinus TaxID=2768948 RepID=UPI0039A708CC
MFEKLLLAAIITLCLYFNAKIEWSNPINLLQLRVQAPQVELLRMVMFQNLNVR